MDDTSRLTFAAFLVRDSLQFRMTKLEWPERLGISIYDHEASITIGEKQYTGRGVHQDKALSVDIAIAEAFERSLSDSKSLNREFGGIAVHTDSKQAERAATLELIERDAFFCHFLTSAPMLAALGLQGSIIGARLTELCEQFGIQIKAGSLAAPRGYFVSVVALNGTNAKARPFGAILGLGCSEVSEAASLEKAVREVLPNFANAVLGEKLDAMRAESLLGICNPQPVHHRKWALNRDSWEAMAACFSSAEAKLAGVPLDTSKIAASAVERPDNWPSLIPLVAATATHPTAVRSFFGGNRSAAKFAQRLSEFSGKPFNENLLPALPHPLG